MWRGGSAWRKIATRQGLAVAARLWYKQDVAAAQSISEQKTKQAPTGCLLIFGAIFFGAGLLVFFVTAGRPMWRMANALAWRETPCVIIQSGLDLRKDSDGDTMAKVAVQYRYVVAGRSYTGTRFDFNEVNSGKSRRKQTIVEGLRVGTQTVCYVNPERPEEAVLRRGPSVEMWWGLFCVPFLGMGAFIIYAALSERKPKDGAISRGARMRQAGSGLQGEGTGELRVQQSPLLAFFGLLIFTLIWDGVVFWMVREKLVTGGKGGPPWFFPIVFGFFGVLMIWGVLYQFLRLFSPRIRLVVNPPAVRLGERLRVRWEFAGSARRVRKLAIKLTATEQATYARGTDSVTDRSCFFEVPVLETTDSITIAGGEAEVEVPAGLVPTFKTKHNAIEWALQVQGEVKGLPDLKDAYSLTVLPRVRTGGSAL